MVRKDEHLFNLEREEEIAVGDFGETKLVKGYKRHRCDACYAPIAPREPHYHFKGRLDDCWQDWRMHEECYACYASDGYEEFMPGDYPVPERVEKWKELSKTEPITAKR